MDRTLRETVAGREMTRAEADALENRLEFEADQLHSRARLLGYYYDPLIPNESLSQHLLWVIANAPDADVAGSIFCQLDSTSQTYEAAASLWRSHLSASPNDPRILVHAASFFEEADPNFAHQLNLRVHAIDPESWDPQEARFYSLCELAYEALSHGDISNARTLAHELLALAAEYEKDWNYGNAVYAAHDVLGSVALMLGDLEGAITHLFLAADTPGSPQLDSFGPRLSLANALLDVGENESVTAFLGLCTRFWVLGRARIELWLNELELSEGRRPNFMQNLR